MCVCVCPGRCVVWPLKFWGRPHHQKLHPVCLPQTVAAEERRTQDSVITNLSSPYTMFFCDAEVWAGAPAFGCAGAAFASALTWTPANACTCVSARTKNRHLHSQLWWLGNADTGVDWNGTQQSVAELSYRRNDGSANLEWCGREGGKKRLHYASERICWW